VSVAVAKDATRRLWLHTLDSLAPRLLADTQGETYPFWSPDARWTGFFAQEKLKKVRATGGSPESPV
jgi:hypothetical protein